MKIVFEITPVPASRPRVTKWGTYYSKIYQQFREDMAILIKTKPKTLYSEPLEVDVTFFMPIAKSTSKKKKELLHGTYCTKKIDLDNLEKAIYDAMSDYIYLDDSQIVEHTTRKVWTKENPRIEISIKLLTPHKKK